MTDDAEEVRDGRRTRDYSDVPIPHVPGPDEREWMRKAAASLACSHPHFAGISAHLVIAIEAIEALLPYAAVGRAELVRRVAAVDAGETLSHAEAMASLMPRTDGAQPGDPCPTCGHVCG